MDFETIIWLVFALIWLVFSGMNSKRKKEQQQKRKAAPQNSEPIPTAEDPFQEVLREIKRRADEQKTQKQPERQRVNKPLPVEKRPVGNKQQLVKGKEVFSVEEKRKSMEYQSYVRKQRRMEHDADNRHLEDKIQEFYSQPEEFNPIDIDLRDIVIADAILNRPYQ